MRYIAMLRGINPMNGPNAKLITLFEELGFTDVKTVASSGNVLFTTDNKDTVAIEQAIETPLSYLVGAPSLTIVRCAEQIKNFVDSKPFDDRKHTPTTYLAVTFFKQTPHNIQHKPLVVAYESNAAALCTVNDNTARLPFMTQLERAYGKGITTRTWNVVVKIARMMGE